MQLFSINRALIISINRELTFSKLPEGFRRYENDTFIEESVAFKRTFLPLAAANFARSPVRYAFNTSEEFPARNPSVASSYLPSTSYVPSGQPSSSPTAAPTISPQPTSHPSSSGPTNTYKPTVKPTQQPSRVPSREPTVVPTVKPTITPSTQPTAVPTFAPSVCPSVAPTVRPTRIPTQHPSRILTIHPTIKPTCAPTEEPTVLTGASVAPSSTDQTYAIVGYVLSALLGVWFLYYLRQWCNYKLEGVQSDANRALYAASMDAKPKPKFPIFALFVSLFITVQGVEVDFVPIGIDKYAKSPKRVEETAPTTVDVNGNIYCGLGAFIDGPSNFKDLEANKDNVADEIIQTTKPIPGTVDFKTDPQQVTALDRRRSDSELSSISSDASSVNDKSDASSAEDVTLSGESLLQRNRSNSLLGSTISGADNVQSDIEGEPVATHKSEVPLQRASHDGSSGSDSIDYSFPSSNSGDGDWA